MGKRITQVARNQVMMILGLDTSTLAGSIALIRDEQILGEVSFNLGRKHTERLLPEMDWLFHRLGLEPKSIEGIAVGIGPGSFTGVRVGLATAKGLALSLSVPIVGVSSLEALAWSVRFYDGPILALLDARKGEVFARFYQGGKNFQAGSEHLVIPPDRLIPMIKEKTLAVGEGSRIYQDQFQGKAAFAGFEFEYPRASIIGKLGWERLARKETDPLEQMVPIYLRPSDAEFRKAEVS